MFEKYMEEMKKIVNQYYEGCITAEDGFNAICARSIDLSETEEYIAHIAPREIARIDKALEELPNSEN